MSGVVRRCRVDELDAVCAVINDGAGAYRGVIPDDRWHEPYMEAVEFARQIDEGVEFWGTDAGGELAAVMGLQRVADVLLIRHAYVRTDAQRQGLGGRLLDHLKGMGGGRPLLVGTWRAATWAIAFYRRHGFAPVAEAAIAPLLDRYWNIPARQVATSVVLADAAWFTREGTPSG